MIERHTPMKALKRIGTGIRPRPRGRPRTIGLRERILASAVKLFGEKSFAEVHIDDVAADSGIGKGSIYREFGSKESLYATAINTGLSELLKRIAITLRTQPPGPDAIATVIREASEYFWNHGEFFALLRNPVALPASQLTNFRQERSRLSSLIVKTLQEGIVAGAFRDDIDPEIVVEAILGMIRGIRRHRREGVTVGQAVAAVNALFLQGYTNKPEQRAVTHRATANRSV
jgi:AcrR family transcriptional regulator